MKTRKAFIVHRMIPRAAPFLCTTRRYGCIGCNSKTATTWRVVELRDDEIVIKCGTRHGAVEVK